MWCINQVQKYKGDLIKYSDDQEIKAERSNLMIQGYYYNIDSQDIIMIIPTC